jgi:hypothetical protein
VSNKVVTNSVELVLSVADEVKVAGVLGVGQRDSGVLRQREVGDLEMRLDILVSNPLFPLVGPCDIRQVVSHDRCHFVSRARLFLILELLDVGRHTR